MSECLVKLRSCYLIFVDFAKLMKKNISCKGNARNVLSRVVVPYVVLSHFVSNRRVISADWVGRVGGRLVNHWRMERRCVGGRPISHRRTDYHFIGGLAVSRRRTEGCCVGGRKIPCRRMKWYCVRRRISG